MYSTLAIGLAARLKHAVGNKLLLMQFRSMLRFQMQLHFTGINVDIFRGVRDIKVDIFRSHDRRQSFPVLPQISTNDGYIGRFPQSIFHHLLTIASSSLDFTDHAKMSLGLKRFSPDHYQHCRAVLLAEERSEIFHPKPNPLIALENLSLYIRAFEHLTL